MSFWDHREKLCHNWRDLNLSFEEREISSINSCNIDGPWGEIRIWEVSFRREKALGSFWALILESLSRVTETCRNGVETTEGHRHNAVILKVKLLPSEKKFKNQNHSIIYLIPSSGHDTSLKWGGGRFMKHSDQNKLLNWNCLSWDRTVCPFSHHLLTFCSPISDQYIAWHILDNQPTVGGKMNVSWHSYPSWIPHFLPNIPPTPLIFSIYVFISIEV